MNSETPVVRCFWGAMDLTTEVNEVCNRGNLILGGNTFGYLLFEVKKLEVFFLFLLLFSFCLVACFEQNSFYLLLLYCF